MGKQERVDVRSGRSGTAVKEAVAQHPWAWIFLAANPLFIINQIHTIDFYIKAVYIGVVLFVAFLATKNHKRDSKQTFGFNLPELFWMGYMAWGTLALTWSLQPILGFERLIYLVYGIAAYIIGKQTRFWESTLFWNVFAGVAMLVGLIGVCMYLFYGNGWYGFDWIMSAGRPSSTLSYRAYAGTYMVMTLPFLLWFMFSHHVRSVGHFSFASAAFLSLFLFMLYSRARSGWIGMLFAFLGMELLYVFRELRIGDEAVRKFKRSSFTILTLLALVIGLIVGIYFQGREDELYRGLESGFLVGLLYGGGAFVALWMVGSAFWLSAAHLRELLYSRKIIPLGIMALLIVGLAGLPASDNLIEGDKNPQKLKGTGKEELGGAIMKTVEIIVEGKSDRLQFWNISERMLFGESVRKRPEGPLDVPFWATGIGIGQWPVYVPIYSSILHSLGAEIHNDWVQALVETGPIGFLCWIGFLLALMYYASRYRRNPIMIACIGGLLAWVFSTQTDFLTARIYGLLWVGGIAAIIVGIAKPAKVWTFPTLNRELLARLATVGFLAMLFVVYVAQGLDSSVGWMLAVTLAAAGGFIFVKTGELSTARKLAAVYFLYLAVGYLVTALCDRQIYTALVNGKPPVDQLVKKIFATDEFPSYRYGIGKYLIFSPITDLSRAVSRQMQAQQKQANNQQTFDQKVIDNVQMRIAEEVMWMHPYNHNALAIMVDINSRSRDFDRTLELNDRYLDIRPKDAQMLLFRAQTLLSMGDSVGAGRQIHRAHQASPQMELVQQFWRHRIDDRTRRAVESELGAFSKEDSPDADEDETLSAPATRPRQSRPDAPSSAPAGDSGIPSSDSAARQTAPQRPPVETEGSPGPSSGN